MKKSTARKGETLPKLAQKRTTKIIELPAEIHAGLKKLARSLGVNIERLLAIAFAKKVGMSAEQARTDYADFPDLEKIIAKVYGPQAGTIAGLPAPLPIDAKRWPELATGTPAQTCGIDLGDIHAADLADAVHAWLEGDSEFETCRGGRHGKRGGIGGVDFEVIKDHLLGVAAMRYILGADHALRVAAAVIKQAQNALGKSTREMDIALALCQRAARPRYSSGHEWRDFVGIAEEFKKLERKPDCKSIGKGVRRG